MTCSLVHQFLTMLGRSPRALEGGPNERQHHLRVGVNTPNKRPPGEVLVHHRYWRPVLLFRHSAKGSFVQEERLATSPAARDRNEVVRALNPHTGNGGLMVFEQ